MDTDRSDEGQFSTPRAGARAAGYSSASDNEEDAGGRGYSSARSWTSDNEYITPRGGDQSGGAGGYVTPFGSDSEVEGFYSGREEHRGYGQQHVSRSVQMPFVAGGHVPQHAAPRGDYGFKSAEGGVYGGPVHPGHRGVGYPPHQQQAPYGPQGPAPGYDPRYPQQPPGAYASYPNGQPYIPPPAAQVGAPAYVQGGHPSNVPGYNPHHHPQHQYAGRPPPQQHQPPQGYYNPPPHQGASGYDPRYGGGTPTGQPQYPPSRQAPYYPHQPPYPQGRGLPRAPDGYYAREQQSGHQYPRGPIQDFGTKFDEPYQRAAGAGGGQAYHNEYSSLRQQGGAGAEGGVVDDANHHLHHQQHEHETEGHAYAGLSHQPSRAIQRKSSFDSGAARSSSIGNLGPSQHAGASEEDIQAVISAARHGRVDEVSAYLDHGIPVNIRDKFGNTILAIACQNGLKKMAKLALRRGADINARNYKGNTPLHFCFTYGYGDSLGEYLISKGADPTIKNHEGSTCYEGLGGTVGNTSKK